MATLKQLKVTAHPCVHRDGFYRTAYSLWGGDPIPRVVLEVRTVDEARQAIADWVHGLEVPPPRVLNSQTGKTDTPFNAWNMSIEPVSGRWAPGFKVLKDEIRYVDMSTAGAS